MSLLVALTAGVQVAALLTAACNAPIFMREAPRGGDRDPDYLLYGEPELLLLKAGVELLGYPGLTVPRPTQRRYQNRAREP